ncbi:mucin-2 protein [Nocardioides sp. DS6]|uniref:Mucin-2 protein n=1 Tax=Nocardioides eburneus TaxID=3231482 RepID=A0ABV3T006_9ACTN
MALSRHKRDTDARRKLPATLVAGAVAFFATGAAVLVGVGLQSPSSSLVADDASASPSTAPSTAPGSATVADREHAQLSRSMNRQELAREAAQAKAARARKAQAREDALARAAAEHTVPRWTTTDLNLWTEPGKDAKQLDVLAEGKKVAFAGRTVSGRDEIVLGGAIRWVTTGYLSKDKPVVTGAAAGLSDAPCPDSSVENGLTAEAVHVYRSVCHAFPMITSYGGWDAHGEHSSGKAIDIMTTDKAVGDEIADYLQAHAAELDLYDVIWWDRIWTPVRASEGWRAYGDHGSATANHMDHVHVSTNN